MAKKNRRYLGHLLISNPNNPKDELERSVIMIVTHTDSVGIGLQINNPNFDLPLGKVCHNMGIDYNGLEPIWYGGNMMQNKIHVIHSMDWRGLSTVALNKDIGITNDISILAAISRGEGPEYFKACTGYWLWEDSRLDIQLDPRNRLETEPHKWELIPASIENTFEVDYEDCWQNAIEEVARLKVSEWI